MPPPRGRNKPASKGGNKPSTSGRKPSSSGVEKSSASVRDMSSISVRDIASSSGRPATEKSSSSDRPAKQMASSAGPSSQPLKRTLPPSGDADITKKVIEYLVKKGYNKTEQTLRQESAHLDKDGRPIHNRVEELGNIKYTKGYKLLSDWIDQNLDLYKASCILTQSFWLLTDRIV